MITLKPYTTALLIFWTGALALFLVWSLNNQRKAIHDLALNTARITWEKDLLYRRWNANHGGVYAPVNQKTHPNPYLAGYPERDIVTPSGRELTLVNPAYMTRQVYELVSKLTGVRGHITSLRPLRQENAADAWETQALTAFEQGIKEVSSVENLEGQPYLRLMRPFRTEKGCIKCHTQQGYKEGDIRGGLSVSLPMAPLENIGRQYQINTWVRYILVWLLGVCGIAWGSHQLSRSLEEQRRGAEEREKLLGELQEAMAQVKVLSGILPICANCKKIRDDQGYWKQVETYIRDHSEADFSHSICPECAKILYPDLLNNKSD
ncbi:MAG: Tll0287-like domain-containing protein [Desulfobaccales bacterium]